MRNFHFTWEYNVDAENLEDAVAQVKEAMTNRRAMIFGVAIDGNEEVEVDAVDPIPFISKH